MVTTLPRGLSAALCLAALGPLAQTVPPSARPDPLDAKASVPPVVYRSSLPPVRASEGEKSIPWREANDNVTRIGGWRSYLREAQGAAPAPSVPASPAAALVPTPADVPHRADKAMPAEPGHSGHKTP